MELEKEKLRYAVYVAKLILSNEELTPEVILRFMETMDRQILEVQYQLQSIKTAADSQKLGSLADQKSIMKNRSTLTLLSQRAQGLVRYLWNLTPFFTHDASQVTLEVPKVCLAHPLIYQSNQLPVEADLNHRV